jgi:hypothetical protein
MKLSFDPVWIVAPVLVVLQLGLVRWCMRRGSIGSGQGASFTLAERQRGLVVYTQSLSQSRSPHPIGADALGAPATVIATSELS